MQIIYISGIGGFLGENIVELLLKQKDVKIVRLVIPSDSNKNLYDDEKITLIGGNILSFDDIVRFLSSQRVGEKIFIHASE